jgi:Iodothyronine deiodinase
MAGDKGPYRFEHFDIRVMFSDLRFSRAARKRKNLDMGQLVQLSDGRRVTLGALAGDKPLVMVTGSLSCPMTVSALPYLRDLQDNYQLAFNIMLVYVREAHPGERYQQASSMEEKRHHACEFASSYDLSVPVLVDELDGTLHKQLDTKPNSLHIINRQGEILFQALWSGDVEAVKQALSDIASGKTPEQKLSERMLSPFLRGAGYMHQILNKAGKRAYRELLFGAPPVWLLSRTAAALSMFSPERRGVIAVGILLLLVALVAWMLL